METSTSSGNPLLDLSDNLAGIVERVGQHVVAMRGRHRIPSSGVIWRHGAVVTAAHTPRREDEINVTLANNRPMAHVACEKTARKMFEVGMPHGFCFLINHL